MSETKATTWGFGVGMSGCLYDYTASGYESRKAAVEGAAELYELTPAEAATLAFDGILRPEGARKRELAIGDYIEVCDGFEADSDDEGSI